MFGRGNFGQARHAENFASDRHEKTGASGPLLQGGWMLRPFRGVANLINLVEPPTEKKINEVAPPVN
jgi:hypothetical protein